MPVQWIAQDQRVNDCKDHFAGNRKNREGHEDVILNEDSNPNIFPNVPSTSHRAPRESKNTLNGGLDDASHLTESFQHRDVCAALDDATKARGKKTHEKARQRNQSRLKVFLQSPVADWVSNYP